MTDQNPAVAALAEAIAAVTKRRGGHGNPACYMQSAEDALQAIRADPELAGFKTMTVSAWEDANDSAFNGRSELPQPPYLIVPDPQPPEPTLQSVYTITANDADFIARNAVDEVMKHNWSFFCADDFKQALVQKFQDALAKAPRP